MNTDMPEMEEKKADPAEAVNELRIGETLRKARESLNISIEHAARQLNLDVRLLTALETDDYDSLPGTAYAYGYLRSYAKLLKLADEELLQQFLQFAQISSNTLVPEHMTFAKKNKVPSFSFRQTLVVFSLFLLALGSIAWVLLSGVLETTDMDVSVPMLIENSDTEAEQPAGADIKTITDASLSVKEQQQIAQPDSQQVSHLDTTSTVGPAKELQLTYQADSWTEVRDAKGETLIYRMVNSGERLELEGQAPYTILLGYAPGVSVVYKKVVFDTKPYQRDDIAYFKVGLKRSTLATD